MLKISVIQTWVVAIKHPSLVGLFEGTSNLRGFRRRRLPNPASLQADSHEIKK